MTCKSRFLFRFIRSLKGQVISSKYQILNKKQKNYAQGDCKLLGYRIQYNGKSKTKKIQKQDNERTW